MEYVRLLKHEPSTFTGELNCILLFDYKGTLHEYNINNTRFEGLKSAQWERRLTL